MQQNSQLKRKILSSSTAGFTLLEQIVIVLMIGILGAIAVPSWMGLIDRQQLNTAQDQVYRAIQEAKSNALKDKIDWQASFREQQDGIVQWAIHPVSVPPAAALWHNFHPNIRIDPETTMQLSQGVRRVIFDYQGNTDPPFGRLTLTSLNGGKAKRCVIVSTLLGALRTAKENPEPKDGKYCD